MNFLLFFLFSYFLTYLGYLLHNITKEEQEELKKILEWIVILGAIISLVCFGYILYLQNNIIYLALVLFSFIATLKRKEFLDVFLYLYFIIFALSVFLNQELAYLLITVSLLLLLRKGQKQFNLKKESLYALGIVLVSVILFSIQTF